MVTNKARKRRIGLASTFVALSLAVGLAGCGTSRETTGSISRGAGKPIEQLSNSELAGAASSLGKAYTKDTKNRDVALRYATVLQMQGETDQSLAVMRKLVIDHPKDRPVLAAYGKSLAAAGQLEPALDAIRRAQTPEYPDWKLLSAEGAILDQIGKKAEARELYRKALDLKPNEPSVLSNLGMSYVLEGDLKTAETYMRDAMNAPGADSRVRQNYALVIGLQGRFDEAEKIASQELSPDQAKANVAYLRSMLAQQNAWSQIKAEDKKKSATN
ncbi:tetratricopeptide repeat protein [Pseudaminobacter sp. 19-2017]|uniref:Tetratricopeptide repeat protein n=1 Tax=Pseudaminobacter soli (ex Zhang et al. 2022) TaxID=2831468 RepID=A0A942DYJ0_9HYPH|nr:tetratricopeptide repeat protein [Pseudaminobacter soli]MBS3649738.1 tetratricopeptide repeat protein [Pseudaminobacter soli]